MKIGVVSLVLAYMLSQFYRAFLAVLAPALGTDLGATPEQLSLSSSFWFVSFAFMQVPVGIALDRVGPRLTAAVMLAFGGGLGAITFATANSVTSIHVAMILIGIGCAPLLMASYYIFARQYSAAVFGTLAGAVIGFGSLGNIAASLPLAFAADLIGWRQTGWVLAAVSIAIAALVYFTVRDPEKPKTQGGQKGSFLDLLRIPALWPILLLMSVSYAPSASLRGLWAGPYLADVHGLDGSGIGQVTLAMALAMIVGNFAYGPLDRVFGSRKWVILIGNVLSAVSLLGLGYFAESGVLFVSALIALSGLFGASFPLIMAHGRAFVPEHLTGRGVTLLNLFGIGGTGIIQFSSGPLFKQFNSAGATTAEAYSMLFTTFGIAMVVGCLIYLFSKDRTD